MSKDEQGERTVSRLRYVAPPGLEISDSTSSLKTIGRYEILEILGSGAMGIVYKARDPLLDRVVAVKTIVSPKANNKSNRRAYLERFEREAKAAAKMQHPAIVTIFDVGSHEGKPFMVLEYLPGDSLATRLDLVRIPLAKGVQMAIDLAGALGFAHKEQIVHRDVKPANILNSGDTRWKLADFGIARVPNSDLTQVGIFMGTPGYAPPEAIREGRYTAQADVFAWGAVFYEILSGRIPYEGPDTKTTNALVLKECARSPREFDSSIPKTLAQVCMTALHPSPAIRYKNGSEAQAALEAAWEICIGEEMIGARAFSNKELPHDQAPMRMHAPPLKPGEVSPVETLLEDDGLDTLVEEEAPTIVLEAKSSAPSQIVNQGGARKRSEETSPDEDLIALAKEVASQNDSSGIEALAKAAANSPDGNRGGALQAQSSSMPAGLIAFAVVLLICTGLMYWLFM